MKEYTNILLSGAKTYILAQDYMQGKNLWVTTSLVKLHWLTIPEIVEYKILLLVYKVFDDKKAKLLVWHVDPKPALPSFSQNFLTDPKAVTKWHI